MTLRTIIQCLLHWPLYREKDAHGHAIFSEVVPGTDFSKILIREAVRGSEEEETDRIHACNAPGGMREQLTSWDAAAIAPSRIISLKRGTEGSRTTKILSKWRWTCSSSTRIGKKWILRLLLIRFLCIPISDPGNAEPLALHRDLPKLGTCCFLYTLSLEKGRPGNLVSGGSAKSAVRTKPKSVRKNGKVATPYGWSNLVCGGSARSAGRRKPKSIRKNRKVASSYDWSFLLLPWLHTPLGDYIEFKK